MIGFLMLDTHDWISEGGTCAIGFLRCDSAIGFLRLYLCDWIPEVELV